jgi:hypothetical protein
MTWIGGVKRYCPVFRSLPLVVQVEHQRRGVAGAGDERCRAADHEAQSGHAFEALVARSRQRRSKRARIDLERAKGAHRVDRQPATVARDDRGDVASGLRMPLVVSQCTAKTCVIAWSAASRVQPRDFDRRVLRCLVQLDCAAGDARDPERAGRRRR